MSAPTLDLSRLRVLVTGSSGLVGRAVVRHLEDRGATVVGLTRGTTAGVREPHIRARLEDADAVEAAVQVARPDGVIHLGGQSRVGASEAAPRAAFEANVQGTWNLLEALRRHAPEAALVVASSDAVYGDAGGAVLTESQTLAGQGIYATSKIVTESVGRSFADAHGLRLAFVRSSNAYGGGDPDPARLVPSVVRALLRGSRPVLRGTGREERDFVHVTDLARGYVALVEALLSGRAGIAGEAFNLASGTVVTILALAHTAAEAAGRPDLQPEVLGEAPAAIARKALSTEKSLSVLGWAAELDLASGLRETIAWYRKNEGT